MLCAGIVRVQTMTDMTVDDTVTVTERGLARMREQLARLQERLRDAEAEVDSAQNGSGDSEGLMAVEAVDTYAALKRETETLARRIERAVVVTGSRDGVGIGSLLTLDFGDGDEQYCYGSIDDGDEQATAITPDSPLGRAVVGKTAGDVVNVDAPNGSYQVRIVAIG